MVNTSMYRIASRFIGTREIKGAVDNPAIMTMLRLDNRWPEHDEIPWCSAFINYIAWILGYERTKKLNARSWLVIGKSIRLEDAVQDSDIVIFKVGDGPQPGSTVLNAPGHVSLFSEIIDDELVSVLGGNQSDSIGIRPYRISDILSVRRLSPILDH